MARRVGQGLNRQSDAASATMPALIAQNAPQSAYANTNAGHASSRMAAIAAIPVMMESGASEPASMPERRLVIQNSTNAAEPVRSTPNAGERTRGVGSAFRSPTSPSSEIMR